MEEDGPADTKTCERTEGAATAEKLSPWMACTAIAAPSVRSRVFVSTGPSASMARRGYRASCSRLAKCCSKSIVISSIFLSHTYLCAPPPEGRSRVSREIIYIERIILTTSHWGKHKGRKYHPRHRSHKRPEKKLRRRTRKGLLHTYSMILPKCIGEVTNPM